MGNIGKSGKIKKHLKLLADPRVKIIISLIFAGIGFGANVLIQNSHIESTKQILTELLHASKDITPEQIGTVLNAFNSPVSLDNFVFAFLSFFFGLILTNLFAPPEPQKGISEATIHYDIQDGVIEDLLHHLTDQVYNRCSHTSDQCAGCAKFASECDALLRRYLYEESIHLQLSIKKSRDGQYVLDNDIPRFHTIAIDHLLGAYGSRYSVIQWIGSTPYSASNLYDETYDSLDFDFLYALLSKVMTKTSDGKAYYEKALKEGEKFKIKWLLIGSDNCMKNNFDYIFYTIKKLPCDHLGMSLEQLKNIVSTFFEFYIIDEDKYNREINLILRKYHSDTCNTFFSLANKPSLGIFGNQFMFVDSLDQSCHGTIYTRDYNPNRNAQSMLDMSIEIFTEILSHTKKIDFSTYIQKYEDIIADDSEWENHLKTIWNDNKGEI